MLSLPQMSKSRHGCFHFESDLFALKTSTPESKLLNDVYKPYPTAVFPLSHQLYGESSMLTHGHRHVILNMGH